MERFSNYPLQSKCAAVLYLLDTKEQKLSKPTGYTPDITEYEQWLKSGIAKFQK